MNAPLKQHDIVQCAYRGTHLGVVLRIDDPRVRANTIAFPELYPEPSAVRAHVAKHALTLRDGRLPVAWGFGRIYWDSQLTLAVPPEGRDCAPDWIVTEVQRSGDVRFPLRVIGHNLSDGGREFRWVLERAHEWRYDFRNVQRIAPGVDMRLLPPYLPCVACRQPSCPDVGGCREAQ